VKNGQIQKALERGLALACATCARYWQGRERGLPGDECTSASPCGGPIAGSDFPLYIGPITDFSQWCFACGGYPELGIKVPGSPRIFGVCRKHLKLLDLLAPPTPVTGLSVLSPSKGIIVPISGRYTQKTLGEVIHETECEWAEEDQFNLEKAIRRWV
jgi:hypothetical protein